KALNDHPLVGEGRARGMLGGVELVSDKATKKPFDPKMLVGAKANGFIQDEGLILRNMGDTIGICPPLIISEEQLNTLFDRLETALDKTEQWVESEGLR
ncbi:MAG: aminotransferase class III-fold pyridoxal phosphate-dependent enzyme, partial [Robiginitomaculum sp.]|nr:aminotransferase class III-fold pyridoxal phosphate-dependent enzyme [Robiginitomaculum sp.]